jgi:hypothetical protein
MDDRPLRERLVTVLEYQLAVVRGRAFAGDDVGVFETLQSGVFSALAALGAEIESEDTWLQLPDLQRKWAQEAATYVKQAYPPLPPAWGVAAKNGGPGATMLLNEAHRRAMKAGKQTRWNLEAITYALQILRRPEPLAERFFKIVVELGAAPPLIMFESLEAAARGNGHG